MFLLLSLQNDASPRAWNRIPCDRFFIATLETRGHVLSWQGRMISEMGARSCDRTDAYESTRNLTLGTVAHRSLCFSLYLNNRYLTLGIHAIPASQISPSSGLCDHWPNRKANLFSHFTLASISSFSSSASTRIGYSSGPLGKHEDDRTIKPMVIGPKCWRSKISILYS